MNLLKDWNNVIIVDKVLSKKIKGKKFIFTPYVPNGRFQEALETLNDSWEDANCIFAHQEFAGCKMGAIISIDGDKWPITAPLVVSGHIHSRQKPQENIYYSGSALQHAFGESEKNILAYLTFDDDKYHLDEINLELPRKKIIYMDVEDIDSYNLPETEDKLKVTLSGNQDQFKALKKTEKYKKLINEGIKVVFKPKKIKNIKKFDNFGNEINVSDEDIKKEGTDFNIILNNIINEQKNLHLKQLYELVVNDNKINLEDIMYI